MLVKWCNYQDLTDPEHLGCAFFLFFTVISERHEIHKIKHWVEEKMGMEKPWLSDITFLDTLQKIQYHFLLQLFSWTSLPLISMYFLNGL